MFRFLEAWRDPRPVVFVLGTVDNEPDVHARLMKGIEGTLTEVDSSDVPPLDFRSLPPDHIFLEKKAMREAPSFEGVLKGNWMDKHRQQLPSVVVLLTPFCVDWSGSEWLRREGQLQEKYMNLRNVLGQRDARILIVAVKTGSGLGAVDKDVMDERIISLKRNLQLDNRTFTYMAPTDFTALSPPLRRLCKSMREYSTSYYQTQAKRVIRNMEQRAVMASNPKSFQEGILTARHTLKVAYFSDFQGQRALALRYYRQSFQALVNAADNLGVDNNSSDLADQIKHVAELVNFKICTWLLRSNAIRDAAQQFKAHIATFKSNAHYERHLWRHFAWLSEQYTVFAGLLERHCEGETSLDADKSLYYQNAAKYALKRQASFNRLRSDSSALGFSPLNTSKTTPATAALASSNAMSGNYKGMILSPPKYIGSPVQFVNPALDQGSSSHDDSQLAQQYMEEQELEVDHHKLIMELLNKAHIGIPPTHLRRRAHLRALIAEQFMSEGDFELAISNLTPAVESLIAEGWISTALPLLRKKMSCAVYLGRPRDYLITALTLYSTAAPTLLNRYEKEELHRDVLSVMTTFGRSSTTASSLTTPLKASPLSAPMQYVGLPLRPEYGMAATADQPSEYNLPHGYVVDMSSSGIKMFGIKASFGPRTSSIEVGQLVNVRLTITSHFHGRMTFAEMSVHFSGGTLRKRFVHSSQSSSSSSSSSSAPSPSPSPSPSSSSLSLLADGGPGEEPPLETSLDFPSNHEVEFAFAIHVPESSVEAMLIGDECFLCLERVKFVLRSSTNATPSNGSSSNLASSPTAASSSSSSTSSSPTLSAAIDVETLVQASTQPRDKTDVIFDVSAVSSSFTHIRELTSSGKGGMNMKELSLFLEDSPNILHVTRPSPLVTLLSPLSSETTTLLQGPLQRLNVFFSADKNAVLGGRLYLSSDYSPVASTDAFFWYPNVNSVDEARMGEVEAIDAVFFHPILLNDSKQPMEPLLVSDQDAESVFVVPLFLRALFLGDVRIRLRLEYIPKQGLLTSISKEFELNVTFVRPLKMNFTMTSHKEALGGLPREGPLSTVLRGDTVTMSASLSCLSALGGSIELVAVMLQQSTLASDTLAEVMGKPVSTSASSSSKYFKILEQGSPAGYPLIDEVTELRQGEIVVGSADVYCLETIPETDALGMPVYPRTGESQAPPPVSASIGDVCVEWRIPGDALMKPVDCSKYIKKGGSSSSSSSSKGPFAWLSKLGRLASALSTDEGGGAGGDEGEEAGENKFDMSAVDTSTAISRICGIVFNVNQVQILDAPFDVDIVAPTCCAIGDVISLAVNLRSKLWSPERVVLRTDVNDNYLITGSLVSTIDISPRGNTSISLSLVPLKCGYITLPKILVTWERNAATVIEVRRLIFIQP